MIGISEDRTKHSLAVARYMAKMAAQKGWNQERCQEMFLLGYIHDIGYEFCEVQSEHPTVGADLLKNQGYKYWREILYHGMATDDYDSEELILLNIADMTIDSSGRNVGAGQRLLDIANRYGVDSVQYDEAYRLANKLKLL